MEHHHPPQQVFISPDQRPVDHNSHDSGFTMIAQGGIESQFIKASFKLLAKTLHSPTSAPATA